MKVAIVTREKLREWKNCPIKFIYDMWGLKPQPLICDETHQHDVKCFDIFVRGEMITWQQHEILLGIEKSLRGEAPRRISVAAGHGIGKSCVLAWITIWFLMTRKGAQVGATSPTRDQIYDVLWKEISVWHRKLDKEIQDLFIWQSTYFRVAQSPNTWFARARTARKEAPEAFAGLHGPAVALLGDEASGVIDEVYRVAEGSLTDKDTLVILISNFTRLEGYFYDTHNSDKENWQRFSFSSIDSPIVKSDFAERIAVKYGSDSDEYRYMVLGLPPKGEGMVDGWLPMFTEDDISNQVADIGSWMKPTYMGVDPSGQGKNKTVCTVRDAFRMKVAMTEGKSNTLKLAEQVVTLAQHYEIKPQNVKLDNFGVGANIGQEIALGVRERIHAVNVGAKPKDDRFINARAEMYWLFREWLKKGGKLVKNEGWRQLLTIRYKRTLAGKIQIMGKEEMIKKGWDSPDCFVAGTKILTPHCSKNIEDMKIGDKVITPFGTRKVIKHWEVTTDKLCKVKFSNGKELIGKGKHKILTDKGFVSLDALTLTDRIEAWNILSQFIWQVKKLLFFKDASIGFRKLADTFTMTFTMEQGKEEERRKHYIMLFGSFIQENKFLKDMSYTIKTIIHLIIPLRILNLNLTVNTQANTWLRDSKIQSLGIETRNNWKRLDPLQASGMEVRRVENGTDNMANKHGLGGKQKINLALIVGKDLSIFKRVRDFVRISVNLIMRIIVGGIIQIKEFVYFVKKSLWQIGIGLSNVVVVSVQTDFVSLTKVYNLTLDKDNVYYANGILVENCADSGALSFVPAEVGRETTGSIRTPIQEVDTQALTNLY